MKLLTITIDCPPCPGGVASYTKAMCDFFGEKMEVLTDVDGASEALNNKVHEASLSQKKWPHWMAAVRELKKHEADMVFTHHVLPLGIACLMNKRQTNTPYVVVLHGMDFDLATRNPWKRWITKQVLREAHGIVVTTKFMAERVREFVGLESVVVPPIPGVRGRLEPSGSNKLRMLTVGRLVERKGVSRVLDALKNRPDLHDSLEYRIVGADAEHREAIESSIASNSLDHIVDLHIDATDDERDRHYRECDVFVMPTIVKEGDREGFGIVYLEAATYGLPSIASNLQGVDEAVIDRETGILVNSEAELEKAIEAMVIDRLQLERYGNAAKARVDRDFVPDTIFKPLQDLLGL